MISIFYIFYHAIFCELPVCINHVLTVATPLFNEQVCAILLN